MDAEATRWKRGVKFPGARLLAAGLAGLLIYCAAEQRRPVSSTAPAPLLSAAVPAVRAAEMLPAALPLPAEPLSLERFTPLFALSELAPVTRALEQDKPAEAARALETVLGERRSRPGEAFRFEYLRGRLYERAAEYEAALEAYDRAASEATALVGYARLGATRVLLALGRSDEALRRLGDVPREAPLGRSRELLVAAAALKSGALPLAIDSYRSYLASGERRERAEVALKLAEALLDRAEAQKQGGRIWLESEVVEALTLAREAAVLEIDRPKVVADSESIERRALGYLGPSARAKHKNLSAEQQLARVRALGDARRPALAEKAAEALVGGPLTKKRADPVRCEAQFLLAKALSSQRRHDRAEAACQKLLGVCQKPDEIRVRALFLAGRSAAASGNHRLATQHYAKLELEFPTHSLADDARLNAALSHLELGSEARFVELLSGMSDDYPQGDMTPEGLFRLTLRRVDRGDWAGSIGPLERAVEALGDRDRTRGADFAGRERYFRARARLATGDRESGMAELAALISDFPLSYYMLLAYTRLEQESPERALAARREAVSRAEQEPFSIVGRPEFKSEGFVRAMELFTVGDTESAERELSSLGFTDPGSLPDVLWGVALLYARVGSTKISHSIARRVLGSSPARWPSGAWSAAWQLAYPRPYESIVDQEAKKNDLSKWLVYAIMREESAFDPDAQSPANAHGLMQLIVPTAKMFARPLGLPYDRTALRRPPVNIALGTRALKSFSDKFAENPLLGIAAYNAGPGAPLRWRKERPDGDFDVWVELIPYLETRRYIKRVLSSRAAYGYLYEPERSEELIRLPLRISG
jgi:soluble lytic murein transglycosylase